MITTPPGLYVLLSICIFLFFFLILLMEILVLLVAIQLGDMLLN